MTMMCYESKHKIIEMVTAHFAYKSHRLHDLSCFTYANYLFVHWILIQKLTNRFIITMEMFFKTVFHSDGVTTLNALSQKTNSIIRCFVMQRIEVRNFSFLWKFRKSSKRIGSWLACVYRVMVTTTLVLKMFHLWLIANFSQSCKVLSIKNEQRKLLSLPVHEESVILVSEEDAAPGRGHHGRALRLPREASLFVTWPKNRNPTVWPESYIKILFQACVKIGSLVQTNNKLP